MQPQARPHDLLQDPHLLAALRHAPDHGAAAPPEIGLALARLARAALQPPPSPWRRFFASLRRVRLQPLPAGAFATLMLAGFVGLMWREGVPPEAMPGPGHSAAPSPVAVPASDTASAVAAAAAPVPPVKLAAAAPVPAAPPPPAVLPEAAPATAAAPAPAATPAATPAAAPIPERAAAREAFREPARTTARSEANDTTVLRLDQHKASPPPNTQLPPADPLAQPLAALAAGASDALHSQATREHLLALQRAAKGQWRSAPPLPAETGQAVLDADGRQLGRLLLQGRDVTWQDSGGTWRARLLPATTP